MASEKRFGIYHLYCAITDYGSIGKPLSFADVRRKSNAYYETQHGSGLSLQRDYEPFREEDLRSALRDAEREGHVRKDGENYTFDKTVTEMVESGRSSARKTKPELRRGM